VLCRIRNTVIQRGLLFIIKIVHAVQYKRKKRRKTYDEYASECFAYTYTV